MRDSHWEALKEQLRHAQDENMRLETERRAAEREVSNAATAWKELETMRTDLSTCRRQLEEAEKERAVRDSHWEALKEQLRYAQGEITRLESERRTLVIAEAAALAQREAIESGRKTEPIALPLASPSASISPASRSPSSYYSPSEMGGRYSQYALRLS